MGGTYDVATAGGAHSRTMDVERSTLISLNGVYVGPLLDDRSILNSRSDRSMLGSRMYELRLTMLSRELNDRSLLTALSLVTDVHRSTLGSRSLCGVTGGPRLGAMSRPQNDRSLLGALSLTNDRSRLTARSLVIGAGNDLSRLCARSRVNNA